MEFLRAEDGEDVMLVNPNPDRVFQCRAYGNDYTFKPMKKYMVPRKLAGEIMNHAEQAKSNALMQYSAEKNEHLRLLGFEDRASQLKAAAFVDENGEPKTKPWKRPPVVNLHLESGQKIYAEAVNECRAKGIAVEDADTGLPKAPIGIKELVRPKDTWEKDQLARWLEANKVMFSGIEDQKKLYKKAMQTYENLKAFAASVGVNVIDPEDTQGSENDAVVPAQ